MAPFEQMVRSQVLEAAAIVPEFIITDISMDIAELIWPDVWGGLFEEVVALLEPLVLEIPQDVLSAAFQPFEAARDLRETGPDPFGAAWADIHTLEARPEPQGPADIPERPPPDFFFLPNHHQRAQAFRSHGFSLG
jgi:hypothetical protein